MKKIILLICIMLLLTACDKSGDDKSVEDENIYEGQWYTQPSTIVSGMAFSEIVSISNIVDVAVCTGETKEYGGYKDWLFTVSEELKDQVEEKEIWFRLPKNDESFKKGSKYVILAETVMSVYEEHDYYLPLYVEELFEDDAASIDENETKIKEYKSTVEETDDKSPKYDIDYNYIKSDDLSEIVTNSKYVAIVSPKKSSFLGPNNRSETFNCDVKSVLKGDMPENIDMIFVKDSVKTGSEYLVILNKPDSGTEYYLSSKISLINMNDTERVESIKQMLVPAS